MANASADLIRGTADMLILKLLDIQPMHGWGIGQAMQQLSRDALRIQPGALYGSLHRLTREGWIRSAWDTTASGRRARYYSLTRAGARRLAEETDAWRRLSGGVSLILAASRS
jgi:PadR family transcriptional regulator, regulatory protein PadR